MPPGADGDAQPPQLPHFLLCSFLFDRPDLKIGIPIAAASDCRAAGAGLAVRQTQAFYIQRGGGARPGARSRSSRSPVTRPLVLHRGRAAGLPPLAQAAACPTGRQPPPSCRVRSRPAARGGRLPQGATRRRGRHGDAPAVRWLACGARWVDRAIHCCASRRFFPAADVRLRARSWVAEHVRPTTSGHGARRPGLDLEYLR